MKIFLLPLCAAMLVSGPVLASDPCPKFSPGDAYPWQTGERMPGDFWADALIDVDSKGTPTRCRTGAGNMKREQRFWYCNAVMKDARYSPVIKDGVAVSFKVKTVFVLPGRRHREADKAARSRFFAEHPEEKTICYPD
ncbi:hypothetical protein MZO42_14065 [Sphingomonas psychrotolerans]|uniref:TonB C-terminal domain-containing protein n=1 Tax=Sphingomonas psychrotolerans TaxID=1327635 RepID=A0ABU3N5L0_9SPHN|nr:hypothetical protein [Sphingomonas psychrotolerans]MDT8759823.1 hypothetical protein [Sphingomonas psychrotolerans]